LIHIKNRFTFRREHRYVNNKAVIGSLRVLSYVVLAAMAAALVYAAYISFVNWSGIAV
jgi:hypothetical protein